MADLADILAERLAQALGRAFGEAYAGTDPILRVSANPKFGDYQANVAMGLGKTLGLKPREVAEKIVAQLEMGGVCAKVEIAGPGFINLHLAAEFVAGRAEAMLGDERLGVDKAKQAVTTVVDYSGPNVAKEMHVGHLRSSVIGDALARVLVFCGHRVIRQNHLGDWGTQFGMLIEHLMDETAGAGTFTVTDLNVFYQQAKKRFDAEPAFAERARARVVKLQAGDAGTLAAWGKLIEESKRHFEEIYRELGIELTGGDIRAESFYNDLLPGVVAELEGSGLAQVSEGAVCVFPPGFLGEDGQPFPLIVKKKDGGYLYATTDLAALRYRIRELQAGRIVYVTDARQKQHFAMIFKVGEMAGWVQSPVRLDHVPFGTVMGEDGKPFKTRSGETVKLADLLTEAKARALAVMTEKNPTLGEEQRKKIAGAIGIGAVKYADLCNDRIKDYVFAWERMLAFDGNTAPYLQNAYVRIRSIFRKAEAGGVRYEGKGAKMVVTDGAERALMLKLLQFPAAVAGVAEALEPHRLCTYLYELAATYHQFYEKCPVLTATEESTRQSRLALCDLTEGTLRKGLELLGIATVEQM